MAETRKITIEIIQTDGSTPKPTPVKPSDDSDKASNEGKTLLKSVILNQGYKVAKQMIVSSVEASVNRYLTLTEDYMAQNTYNAVKTSISKITTGSSAIVGSAMAGSIVGPIGTAVGAVIGTIGFATSEFISYQSKMSSYYRALNASNIEMNYARKRAGLTDGSRGTEN